ncbi:Cys-tRNA(Pro) deacylase [Anaerosinus sp.]|mgnify:FL=1|uniref:Cys-tRNA(Pro) deacylase n=1 Tax=Selenobaculum sp. TaxID=3074374 RepID=UPI003AB55448
MKKTNVARILDGLNIQYELKEYEVDLEDLSAPNVAKKVGMPLERVFKTLVARGDKNGVLMACIPGGAELNLKALAAASNNKKAEMVHLKEVQGLTGYIRGGVSPLGAKKAYPVYLDQSMDNFETIAVSAGVRGCQIIIAPDDLKKAVNGMMANLIR